MRKFTFVWSVFVGLLIFSLFSSNSAGRASTGQGYGNTGAPGDQVIGGQIRTCIYCHNGPIQCTNNISISEFGTNTPVTSYVPGTVYDVRVTVNVVAGNPLGYGFQLISLRTANNADLNAFSNPAGNVKIVLANTNNHYYAEHNGVTNNNVFLVRWTAPPAGTGDVRFYSANTAVNRNNNDNGDGAASSSLLLPEAIPNNLVQVEAAASVLSLFPNPAATSIQVKGENMADGEYQLFVVTPTGAKTSIGTATVANGRFANQVDVSGLSAGVYSLLVQGAQAQTAQLFVKL